MPKPRQGESRGKFMQRCIPMLVSEEGLPQNQAIGKCGGIFDENKERKDAPGYRSSPYGNVCQTCFYSTGKFWCELYDFEYDIDYVCDSWQPLVYKEVKEMPTGDIYIEGSAVPKITTETATSGYVEVKAVEGTEIDASMVLDKVSGEEIVDSKSMHPIEEIKDDVEMGFIAPASFSELDQIRESRAQAQLVGDASELMPMMVREILRRESIKDKESALVNLAKEFSKRVSKIMSTKEKKEILKEEMRYAAIESDPLLVKENDWQGGCQFCGFGDPVLMKGLEKCPFCHNSPGGG